MAADSTNLCVGVGILTIGSDVGYIKRPDGCVLTHTVELFKPDLETMTTQPEAWITNEEFQFAATFMEATQTMLPIALGTDNAFAGGPPVTMDVGDAQTGTVSRVIVALGSGTEGGAAFTRELTIHKAVVSAPPEIKFSMTQNTELATTYDCLFDDQTELTVYTLEDTVI